MRKERNQLCSRACDSPSFVNVNVYVNIYILIYLSIFYTYLYMYMNIKIYVYTGLAVTRLKSGKLITSLQAKQYPAVRSYVVSLLSRSGDSGRRLCLQS